MGTWSWRDGVICYTDSYSSIGFNHGHAGIVAVSPHFYSVVESNPGTGVTIEYGDWVKRFGTRTVQVGVSSTTVDADYLAAAWAVQQKGKPYGDFYNTGLSDRSKFYCSQLVYAAYKDVCGVNLDTLAWTGVIHPMELVDNDKVTKIFDTN